MVRRCIVGLLGCVLQEGGELWGASASIVRRGKSCMLVRPPVQLDACSMLWLLGAIPACAYICTVRDCRILLLNGRPRG